MTSAKELLGFRFNPDEFALSAHSLAGPDIKREIHKAIQKLEKLDSLGTEGQMPPDAGILYEQFMHLCEKRQFDQCKKHFSSHKKANKLSYILSYHTPKQPSIAQTPYLKVAIDILRHFWRDRMLISLIHSLLIDWQSEYIVFLRELIKEKINSLNSQRSRLIKLKEQSPFFTNEKSTFLLGDYLAQTNQKIDKVYEFMGFEESLLSADFFSEVCVNYVKILFKNNQYFDSVPDIISFLEKHGKVNTAKQIITEFILKANTQADPEFQELIKKAAFQLVGDPENDAYWAPWPHANSEEKQRLKNAQQILNGWIVQQFVELFFDKLAMDVNRKDFWEKYIKHITKFKIYGQESTKANFMADPRLAPYVEKRFGYLMGASNQNALIMFMKNYALIEFSYSGSAFYAYPTHHPDAPDFSNKQLHINMLKPASIRAQSKRLVETYQDLDRVTFRYVKKFRMQNFGKIGHSGHWKTNLTAWLIEYIGI
jgi:hypothetical protein